MKQRKIMKLILIRKFDGLVLYGYIFETLSVYWSMKLYEECDKSARVTEYIHAHRFTEFHDGIVL